MSDEEKLSQEEVYRRLDAKVQEVFDKVPEVLNNLQFDPIQLVIFSQVLKWVIIQNCDRDVLEKVPSYQQFYIDWTFRTRQTIKSTYSEDVPDRVVFIKSEIPVKTVFIPEESDKKGSN